MSELNTNLQLSLGKNGQKVDLDKLKEGIKQNDINKAIFEKFDENNNGILDEDEIENIKKFVAQYGKDGVLSKREAGKVLKEINAQNIDREELYTFLESIQAESEDIEESFYSLFDYTEALNVKYKKDSNGFEKISSYNRETGALIQEYYDNGTEARTVSYNTDGSIAQEEIVKGAKTTVKDGQGRVLKETINKGNGFSEVVEYEYEGDSTTPSKITKTGMDGSVVTDGSGKVISEDGSAETPETKVPPQNEDGANQTVLDNGRIITKTENGTTIQDPGGEPVSVKYDKDGNILSNAKNGETFDQTAERLGIKKGTPEYEKFRELNAKAAKNGWFQVGAEVKIPAGSEAVINLDGLNVDADKEVSKFDNKAVQNADISKYNETNTESRTLDSNTSWWNLAKQSLIDEGNQSPTNADIVTRMNELQKLNSGKQPVKGAEIIMPKNAQDVQDVQDVQETPADEVVEETEENNTVNLELHFSKDLLAQLLSSFKTRDGGDVAEDLYNDIHQIGTGKDFDKHIQDINENNVVDVLRAYDAKSPKESLVEAIFDEIGMSRERQIASVTHIKDALIARSQKLGVDVSVLNAEFEKAFDKATSGILAKIKYVNTSDLDKLINEYTKRIETMEKMDAAARERYMQEQGFTQVGNLTEIKSLIGEITGGDGEDTFGNGKIDNAALQMTGNCWAHAGLNAMIATPQGREMINNLVTKRDGVITVCLPEAAQNGLPKPNGDGIYTFTELDLLEGLTVQSVGDGDVTAVMLALEQYFEETGESANFEETRTSGNSVSRMFEILSGQKPKVFTSARIPDGVGFTNFSSSASSKYSNLKALLDSGKGAIMCVFTDGVSGENSGSSLLVKGSETPAEGSPFISSNHAYAVTKMDDEFVYLVESNNPNSVIKMPKDEFIEKSMLISTYKF